MNSEKRSIRYGTRVFTIHGDVEIQGAAGTEDGPQHGIAFLKAAGFRVDPPVDAGCTCRFDLPHPFNPECPVHGPEFSTPQEQK